MTPKQSERLVKAFESMAASVDVIGKIMERRFRREFPPEKAHVDAQIFKRGEEGEAQELSPEPGRFTKLFTDQNK